MTRTSFNLEKFDSEHPWNRVGPGRPSGQAGPARPLDSVEAPAPNINLTDETSATSKSSANTIQLTTTGSHSTEFVATASASDPHPRPRPAYQSATIQNQPTQTSSTDWTSLMVGSAEQAEDRVGEQANENAVVGSESVAMPSGDISSQQEVWHLFPFVSGITLYC